MYLVVSLVIQIKKHHIPRVTICAIFPARVLARISILPKISRFWLCLHVQIDRCMTSKYHTYGSLCFQRLSRYFDVKHWSLLSTYVICMFNCIALTVDPTFWNRPWLVHYVQCLHVIGRNTFRSLPSASMKTGKQSQNKSWQARVWDKWHIWSP